MKKKGLLRALLLLAAGWLILPAGVHAQAQARDQGQARVQPQDTFAYKAPLDTITRAGWYRVILTPEVGARCQENMADVRIQGADGSYIPYVLKTDFFVYGGESFIEFPILPAGRGDSAGDVRIGNWSGGAIHSLLLYMHVSDAWRTWTLSGSNDGEKWYVIREHIRIKPSYADNSSTVPQPLDFPSSDYHYFRITQENKGLLPLNIYRAGVVTQQAGVKRFRPVPAPVITQKDSSDHHSYITLTFQEPYIIENIKLYVKSPRLFKRPVVVREEPGVIDRTLTSSNSSMDFYHLKTRTITLDVDNEDNAPLVVEKAEASQLEQYLLTWLEPGSYDLLVGDKHAQLPKYDLKYFVDTVSHEPAAIMPGTPTNIHPLPAVQPPKDNKGIYLWSSIIAVLVLLIWLCLNMLKSIRNKEELK